MVANIKLAILLVAVFLLGSFVGYLWANQASATLAAAFQVSLIPIQEGGSPYKLVHPLLAYRTPEAPSYGEFAELERALVAKIAALKAQRGIQRASIYFRDLDTARWVGIDENDTYHPASLLKIPLLIAYYKQAERDSVVFERWLTYHKLEGLPYFDAPSILTEGASYQVKELITRMVIDSDNGATYTLLAALNPEALDGVYQALGISIPGEESAEYKISTRTYGLFFRILYNATYLSPESSEKALALLTKTTFTEGLVAGVPAGVTVAHKFGQYVMAVGTIAQGVELSDCGIVYYPEHAYLMCVMVQADTEESGAHAIRALSDITYTTIHKRYALEEI